MIVVLNNLTFTKVGSLHGQHQKKANEQAKTVHEAVTRSSGRGINKGKNSN